MEKLYPAPQSATQFDPNIQSVLGVPGNHDLLIEGKIANRSVGHSPGYKNCRAVKKAPQDIAEKSVRSVAFASVEVRARYCR